ncbi:MAG: beta-N-acetylglucosaminidase domain-containing protein [Longimicrobiales bacterium]
MQLGIIEGFYGKPWTWAEREETIAFLASHGYGFYLYAPKADPHLRRRWQEAHAADTALSLTRLAAHCAAHGVRFGIGLSPYEIWLDFGRAAQEALARKLGFFDELGARDVALLFDDMRGMPELAERQVEVVEWAAERSAAGRIIVCPTYYSDDPVLDRVFGARPERYLERLGELLRPEFEIFWTGPEVCARELSLGHLRRVTQQLGRRPFLWDNYPVNDGQRMSQYLHLRGFTGRPAALAEHLAGHAINPALQPTLTRIPALTLVDSYRQNERYEYLAATHRAAAAVLGAELGTRLSEDVLTLQDIGLDHLGDRAATLRERYAGADHPGAREIIAWLDGAYRITDEIVQTQ